jgi:hypothetical protein
LAGLQGIELFVYLDDIIIFAKTLEEHGAKFNRLMQRLEKANLTLEPQKCSFLKKEAAYLGHVVGNRQLKPDPTKLEALRKYPIPTNPKKVKQFLGLAGYYRRFILGYAKIALPLTKLLRKTVDFHWGEEQQKAFETLREALCAEPVLQSPDFSQPFIVTTDASDYALGAVLSQGEIGKDRPCSYASRPLRGAELKYSTYEREMLSVVFASEQFRPYLYGREFTVVTDHQPLKWLHDTKRPELRANRLKSKLEGFFFKVVYRPGEKNPNADALSRNPVLREDEVHQGRIIRSSG